MISRAARALLAVVAAGTLTACTSGPATPTISVTETQTQTLTRTPSATTPTGPVDVAPTTVAGGSCPFVSLPDAMNIIGQRLARQQLLKSHNKIIGCRFYALQNSPLHSSENLPGPDQPDIEITSASYASATAAHNAVVTIAEAGTNYRQVDITGVFAALYQTRFDPTDGARDFACAFSSGTRLVVIKTADDDESASVVGIAQAVAAKIRRS